MPILTPEERIGTLVADRYRFESVLARGGMSVLFAGSDVRTHRAVVLKLLRPHDAIDEAKIARFLQETRTTALLRHPYVVDVIDMGRDVDGVPYLVMEHLHGRSLGDELAERGKLAPAEVLAWLLPVMGALAKAHEAGVVHRDLKPENIFLARDPRGEVTPKLLDFGIAKVLESTVETRTGAMLGTPEYMAPEQAKGEPVGAHTDVWGMGAVLYRCLSGRSPFEAQTQAEVIAKIVREAPAPLTLEGVPRAFTASIERALVRDPAVRYASIAALARALVLSARDAGIAVPEAPDPLGLPDVRDWLAHGEAEPIRTLDAPPPSTPPRAERSFVRVALVVALLAVVVVVLVVTGGEAPPPRTPEPVRVAAPEPEPAPAIVSAPVSVTVTAPATVTAPVAGTASVTAPVSVTEPALGTVTAPDPAPPESPKTASRPRRARAHDATPKKKDDALPVATEW